MHFNRNFGVKEEQIWNLPPRVYVKRDESLWIRARVCVCVREMRSFFSTVRVQLLQNPFWLWVHRLRLGDSGPLYKEKVSLHRQPLCHVLFPSFLPWDPSSLTPAAPILPSLQLLVCNSFTVFSFFVSLPPFLFFFKFCIQTPLYTSSPDSTLSRLVLFPLFFFFSFHPTSLFPHLPAPHFFSFLRLKKSIWEKKTFIDGSTSTLPQTRSKLQNYSLVEGAIKIYTEFRDPRGEGGRGGGAREVGSEWEREERKRETTSVRRENKKRGLN